MNAITKYLPILAGLEGITSSVLQGQGEMGSFFFTLLVLEGRSYIKTGLGISIQLLSLRAEDHLKMQGCLVSTEHLFLHKNAFLGIEGYITSRARVPSRWCEHEHWSDGKV